MERSGEQDWAAAHYRVERDSTGLKASRRKRRRIAEEAARYGDPIPEEARDVVRIIDREGFVVMERDWGGNRQAAIEEEARIVEDLLKLDVVHFRARYGIVVEEIEDDDEAGPARSDVRDPRQAEGRPDAGAEGKPEGASG